MLIDEITPEILTKQVILFRDFLVKSWATLDALMENHDWDDGYFINQWVRVNWEFLVERELLGKEIYLTPLISPPLMPRVLSNNADDEEFDFTVVAYLEKDMNNLRDKKIIPKGTRLRLFGFSTQIEHGGFGLYPPFDVADLVMNEKRKEFVQLPIDKLKFTLEPFEPSYFK